MLIAMIGTLLENVQLSQLNEQQLDELAALVNERGVIFFKDQDLTTEGQVKIFKHFGILDKHPSQKVGISSHHENQYLLIQWQDVEHVTIRGSNADWREVSSYTPWPQADFHADTSFEINRELMFISFPD